MSKYRIYTEEGKVEGYLNPASAVCLARTFTDERHTRGTRLYMTPRSKRFFLLHWSMWQGEGSDVEEIGQDRAIEFVRLYGDDADANDVLKELGAEEIKEIV